MVAAGFTAEGEYRSFNELLFLMKRQKAGEHTLLIDYAHKLVSSTPTDAAFLTPVKRLPDMRTSTYQPYCTPDL